MDGLLTISQLAKLRGVTTETLRHYDRIGLFKPAYIDPDTNYRYYSILQYEKLGTIKELRSLNFSLEEIQEYFNNRNFQKSYDMLKEKHEALKQDLELIQHKYDILTKKISYLENLSQTEITGIPSLVSFPKRYYVTRGVEVDTLEDQGFCYTNLENVLDDMSPILATDRIGLIASTDSSQCTLTNRWIPFIFLAPNDTPAGSTKSFPEGLYAVIHCRNGWTQQQEAYTTLYRYIKEQNYKICGDIIMNFPVDLTITDSSFEFSIQIQIPVEKA